MSAPRPFVLMDFLGPGGSSSRSPADAAGGEVLTPPAALPALRDHVPINVSPSLWSAIAIAATALGAGTFIAAALALFLQTST